MERQSILIVEDEKALTRFLELELTHEGYKVFQAGDGREALEQAQSGHYDLILLDILLPGINGIEVCRRIRQYSTVPIIMLTAKDDVTSKVMGLDNGADDYITKPFAIEELLARIRSTLRRRSEKHLPKLLQLSDLVMNLDSHQVSRAEQTIELTKKEFDLLKYLLQNQEVVLTREQILEQVWGFDYYGDTNVVDVYIKYLRTKIDNPFSVKLIQTIRGVGYILKVNHETQ